MPSELIPLVESMVESYPGDRFLYLHRSVLIVRCLAWDFTEDFIRAKIHFERVVIGNDWNIQQWEFAVRSDDINLFRLENNMLSGCQLRDTIVLDTQLLDRAESINPASDQSAIDALAFELRMRSPIKTKTNPS